jgi:hypothetical protein
MRRLHRLRKVGGDISPTTLQEPTVLTALLFASAFAAIVCSLPPASD